MIPETKWTYRKANDKKVQELAETLSISRVTASLLLQRGLDTAGEARRFMAPSLDDLVDPFRLTGMREAVDRIARALNGGENILVYGDYDADGITAAALLYSCLKDLGGRVSFYIPSRFGLGYGLHTETIQEAVDRGTTLMVTVDCGENAVEEIRTAAQKGVDVIVTDHHQPQGEVVAAAHINPQREEPSFPLRNLAGVGVAFKLAQALHGPKKKERWQRYLDLVALGTVADIVPLTGENRILVKYGLEIINKKSRAGLDSLIRVASLDGRTIEAGHIAFMVAPRLNAAGRMGEAWPGVELLTTGEPEKANRIAEEFNEINKKRQQVEQKIFDEACRRLQGEDSSGAGVLVLEEEGWNQGVLGIVASRISELYGKPSILLSLDGQGQARGSGRSVPGFNLVEAMGKAAPLLERFGGHELAAGLTLRQENVAPLRQALNELAAGILSPGAVDPSILLDARIQEAELNLSLAEELSRLSPFGYGNPQPLLGGSFRVTEKRRVGKKGNHLKLMLEDSRRQRFAALSFRNGSQEEAPLRHRRVDLAFFPEASCWRGRKELSLMVKHMTFSDVQRVGSLFLVDSRNGKKKGYLDELRTYNGGTIIIYVNTRREEALFSSMTGGDKVYVVHQGRGSLPEEAGGQAHVVLWSLPMREDAIMGLLAGLGGVEELHLHLLFGKEDFRQNQLLIKASLPGEETLREVYRAVSQSRASSPPGIQQLKEHLEAKLSFPVTRFSVKRALSILGESQMAGPEAAGGFSGANLENSILFREDSAARETCRDFQEYLMTADKAELAAFFATHLAKVVAECSSPRSKNE